MPAPEPLIRIAQLSLIRDSAELEADLASKAPNYITALYKRFRRRAAEAMVAMAFFDPTLDADEFRLLQADLKVFDAFIEETRALLSEGIQLDEQISEQERNEITEFLVGQGERGELQAAALGLIDLPDSSGPQGS